MEPKIISRPRPAGGKRGPRPGDAREYLEQWSQARAASKSALRKATASAGRQAEAPEFDRWADGYLQDHAENVGFSGDAPDYFARYKIDEIRRRWTRLNLPEPRSILDFGSGIGNAWPWLARAFPGAKITALDVSEKSLEVAQARFPGLATAVVYDGHNAPLPSGTFDLVYSACVFHHIPAEQHLDLFSQLRALLRPTGRMAIFEHNPINPVTRYIVATCPFDENAVLIPAGELKRLQVAAGFAAVDLSFTGFFPGTLAALRPIEPLLTWLPIGAQYYTFARA